MCKTIRTRYLGCGGDHVETVPKDCHAAKLKRSKGIWFDCVQKQSSHWSDKKCPVCRRTPPKKLARILKNPVHATRFFTDKNVNILSLEPEEVVDDGYAPTIMVKRGVYREIPYWRMMQHIKIEIALTNNKDAMSGRETPGEIIGRILA